MAISKKVLAEAVQNMTDRINDDYDNDYAYIFTNKRDTSDIILYDFKGCHAGMNKDPKDSDIVGNGLALRSFKLETEEAQDFLEWVTGPSSVYLPVIEHSPEQYHIVRDPKRGNIIRGMITSSHINVAHLTSFFKSTRSVNEHQGSLEFWKKWKMKKGKSPNLVYPLMHYVDAAGNKISRTHGVFDQQFRTDTKMAIHRFVNPKHGEWDLNKNLASEKGSTYMGENTLLWAAPAKKGIEMHKIPIKTQMKIITRFVEKYEKHEEHNYSDATLEYFFDEGYKQYV